MGSPHIDRKVPIELSDGVQRTLWLGMRAIDALERCYPQPAVDEKRGADGELLSPAYPATPATPIRVILSWSKPGEGWPWGLLFNAIWAELLHEWPDLTKEELDTLIDPARMGYYDTQAQEAMRLGLGIPKDIVEAAKAAESAEKAVEAAEVEAKNEPLSGTI